MRTNLMIVFLCLGLLSCAPTAPLQSSRITSKLALGPRFIYHQSRYSIKWGLGRHDTTAYGMPPYLFPGPRWSIEKRIEFTGVVIPIFTGEPGGPVWDMNIKLAIAEIGTPALFRNMCGSAFIGSSGVRGEWELHENAWGGCVVGTYGYCGPGELEVLMMAAGAWNYVRVHTDGFLSAVDAEGRETYDFGFAIMKKKSADITLGAIYKPSPHKISELQAGVTYRIPIERHAYGTASGIRITGFDESPWAFHCGLVFNLCR